MTMNWGCGFVSGHYALVSGRAYEPVGGHAYALAVGLVASRGDCPIEIDW